MKTLSFAIAVLVIASIPVASAEQLVMISYLSTGNSAGPTTVTPLSDKFKDLAACQKAAVDAQTAKTFANPGGTALGNLALLFLCVRTQ